MFGPIFGPGEYAVYSAAGTGSCTADPDYVCAAP